MPLAFRLKFIPCSARYNAQDLVPIDIFLKYGQVPKWPKGADCKSAALVLHRFESYPAHQIFLTRENLVALKPSVVLRQAKQRAECI